MLAREGLIFLDSWRCFADALHDRLSSFEFDIVIALSVAPKADAEEYNFCLFSLSDAYAETLVSFVDD